MSETAIEQLLQAASRHDLPIMGGKNIGYMRVTFVPESELLRVILSLETSLAEAQSDSRRFAAELLEAQNSSVDFTEALAEAQKERDAAMEQWAACSKDWLDEVRRAESAEQQLAEVKAQFDGAMIKHAEKEAWIADLLAQLDAQAGVIRELGEALEKIAHGAPHPDRYYLMEIAAIALAHVREPETK